MGYGSLTAGKNVPEDINVVIEIPALSSPVKYEMNKDINLLEVDRFCNTAMHYPCNYGYVPKTLCGDGDPVDVLVVTPLPIIAGAVIRVRPIGMLEMEDEKGLDNKIIGVPIESVCKQYASIKRLEDLPETLLHSLSHFFEHYKDLDQGKWVKIKDWLGIEAAKQEILDSVEMFANN